MRITPGILITGGDYVGDKVEVLHGDGSPWCTLPRLPQIRVQHSQTGLETCGGGGAGMGCVKLTGGSWTPSHHLAQERYGHTSWASPVGTLLLGGYSDTTTELLEEGTGDSVMHFNLKYGTR